MAQVTILGARGSISLSGSRFLRYGGATSCVLLEMAGETVLLDAGSGLLNYTGQGSDGEVHMLISHTHVDHIIGLPSFAPFFDEKGRYRIYGKTRQGLNIAEQIAALMRPPLWPAGLGSFKASIRFRAVEGSFSIGEIMVDCMESNHPGGSTIYKLSHGDKSVVYATDFEHDSYHSARLAEFSDGCSLLIYDSHFFEDEYHGHEGWGHSTAVQGVKLKQLCGAKQLLLFHHSPAHSDVELDKRQEYISTLEGNCTFAKYGEVIQL